MRRDPPRVLVLTGTSEYPFDRLLAALPALVAAGCASEVRVQSRARPPDAPGVVHLGTLSRHRVAEELAAADVVVTHGGSGSVVEALGHGHVPIVVPRRGDLGEHTDDHQRDLADELTRRGLALTAREPLQEGLAEAVCAATSRARHRPIHASSPAGTLRRLAEPRPHLGRRHTSATRVTAVSAAEYDREVAGLAWRSPLQSSAWGLARTAEGWTPRWWVARTPGGRVLAAAQSLERHRGEPRYVPYGPSLGEHPDSVRAARGLVRRIAAGLHAGVLWAPAWFHVRLGLAGTLREHPLAPSSSTGLVDLDRSDDELRRALRGTWRRDLEKAERDPSISVRFDDPQAVVAPLLEDVRALSDRRGFRAPIPPSTAVRFAERAGAAGVQLLAITARCGDEDLARYVVSVTGRIAQTLWTAGSPDPRAAGTGRLALWCALRTARELGARVYDLAGIDLEGNSGVARFKLGLGPEVLSVPGLAWLAPAWVPPPLARALARPMARVVQGRTGG